MLTDTRWSALFIPVLMLALTATSIARAAEVDHSADVRRILELNIAWLAAVKARNIVEIQNLYTPDGRFMPPNSPPAQGRTAIGEAWGRLLRLPDMVLTFSPSLVEISQSGDLAYDIGTYLLAHDGLSGQVLEHGKYVVVWKKLNGDWKVAADIFNSNLAPRATPKQAVEPERVAVPTHGTWEGQVKLIRSNSTSCHEPNLRAKIVGGAISLHGSGIIQIGFFDTANRGSGSGTIDDNGDIKAQIQWKYLGGSSLRGSFEPPWFEGTITWDRSAITCVGRWRLHPVDEPFPDNTRNIREADG